MSEDPPSTEETPYHTLTPETILKAMESVGLMPTGGLTALNSFENRVYQIETDEGAREDFVIAKFYRPKRWTIEQIREEHDFTFELEEAEVSCVVPMRFDGNSLPEYGGFLFAVYRRQGGHPPNLENEADLEVLARTMARVHALGAVRPFQHRVRLDAERFGHASRRYLLDNRFVPDELVEAYAAVSEQVLAKAEPMLNRGPDIRIHGDCHMGNVLWRDNTPHLVDFDDCMMGPAVQDLWMLLYGERQEQQARVVALLDAYEQFATFPAQSLASIEALRTLRIMHHSAWIARRWHDPAFPLAFPWFNSVKYWSEHILELKEQLAALDEPPLVF